MSPCRPSPIVGDIDGDRVIGVCVCVSCVYACVQINVYLCVRMPVRMCVRMCVRMSVCMCVRMYVQSFHDSIPDCTLSLQSL